ncbi:4'-phosphopantetheinyl transferase family protein [Streptomyces boninensis]|uniref:4'-phosphopantetheinyl transferase family protein n=1 Tax=Streptomyces boninensis TaxID=2039455 RepID=UPI003B21B1AE
MSADRPEVWLLPQPEPDSPLASLDRSVLDAQERHRADNCRRTAGGVLYATAHIMLRRLLAAGLGIPAREVAFTRAAGPHGRPEVDRPPRPVRFSLSHTNGMVLIGVATGPAAAPVGVDVELVPGSETVRVCTAALHPDEQAELAEVEEGPRRRVSFGQLWTRKEAYLKGIGTGLARPLAADYAGADRRRRPAGWTMRDIACGPQHTAAVAIAGPEAVRVRWLAPEWLLADEGGAPYGVGEPPGVGALMATAAA